MPLQKNIRIDSVNNTLIFNLQNQIPELIYIGSKLPSDINIDNFIISCSKPKTVAAIDQVVPLNLHPEISSGFKGHPAMLAYRPNSKTTNWAGKFILDSYDKKHNGIDFFLKDKHRGLNLKLSCGLDVELDVLTLSSTIKNKASTDIIIDWLSTPVIPVLQNLSDYTLFQGRWCGEFNIQRQGIPRGITSFENTTGITSHESFPGIIVSQANTDEMSGECLALHLAWSSNHKLILERLDNGETQIQMGVLNFPSEGRLKENESFKTPKLYVAYSNKGFNALSQQYHKFIRKRILPTSFKAKQRPVTYNTWEAIYFNQKENKLKDLVDNAKDLGIERFVLDDGWFMGRNDDTSSLGDWFVDENKYPNGLNPLITYINNKGMEFGLWIEPEMINENSLLYKKHPNWVLKLFPYPLVTSRNQLVLDLTNKEVINYLYERVSNLLKDHNIAYLKWDMNRILVLAGDNKNNVAFYRQTKAFYKLLDKIRSNYPKVEIESCASGGGRIDYEVLKRVHRFWPSDTNDAIERMGIQMGFSYFFPPELMGSHIGQKWSHTTGRGVSYSFQSLVTSYGHLGVEMDITKLTKGEKLEIKSSIETYKKDRILWHSGIFYRIKTVDPSLVGVAVISCDKKDARLVMTQLNRPRSIVPPLIKIPALNKDFIYMVKLQNESKCKILDSSPLYDSIFKDGLQLSGFIISEVGIQLPALYSQCAVAFSLKAIN